MLVYVYMGVPHEKKQTLSDSKRLDKKCSKTKSNSGSAFPEWRNVLLLNGMKLDAELSMFLDRCNCSFYKVLNCSNDWLSVVNQVDTFLSLRHNIRYFYHLC